MIRIEKQRLSRPLGAFYRNSWAPPRRGLRREVTQCFTGDFGALDGMRGPLGWSRNSAAECFHDGSGRPQNPRPVRTRLPHLRPRGPWDTHHLFSPAAADCRVFENGGRPKPAQRARGGGPWLAPAGRRNGAQACRPPLAAHSGSIRAAPRWMVVGEGVQSGRIAANILRNARNNSIEHAKF